MAPYILYINLKNLNWPIQSILPNGLTVAQKPHAIFVTSVSDFAQINWLKDWVIAGCEVTVELADGTLGNMPHWVSRVSLLYTHNRHPALDAGSKLHRFEEEITKYDKSELPWILDQVGDNTMGERVINADYMVDNRLAWPTHQIALQQLLPYIDHLSVYGLQRHDIKQQLQAWLAKQGWDFYDAFHAKPLVAQPCRFLVESYNVQTPLLGVGAGAYSRWQMNDQWFERKLNAKGLGRWRKLTTK